MLQGVFLLLTCQSAKLFWGHRTLLSSATDATDTTTQNTGSDSGFLVLGNSLVIVYGQACLQTFKDGLSHFSGNFGDNTFSAALDRTGQDTASHSTSCSGDELAQKAVHRGLRDGSKQSGPFRLHNASVLFLLTLAVGTKELRQTSQCAAQKSANAGADHGHNRASGSAAQSASDNRRSHLRQAGAQSFLRCPVVVSKAFRLGELHLLRQGSFSFSLVPCGGFTCGLGQTLKTKSASGTFTG